MPRKGQCAEEESFSPEISSVSEVSDDSDQSDDAYVHKWLEWQLYTDSVPWKKRGSIQAKLDEWYTRRTQLLLAFHVLEALSMFSLSFTLFHSL